MTIYQYIKSESFLWTCGFYDPEGKWKPESDHDSKQSAADRVHYLNGGNARLADDGKKALYRSSIKLLEALEVACSYLDFVDGQSESTQKQIAFWNKLIAEAKGGAA